MAKMTYVWKDRKRTFLGLPLSFTVYKLTEEKLMIETGCFSKKEEEIRLYRIMDMTLNRPFGQRLFPLCATTRWAEVAILSSPCYNYGTKGCVPMTKILFICHGTTRISFDLPSKTT